MLDQGQDPVTIKQSPGNTYFSDLLALQAGSSDEMRPRKLLSILYYFVALSSSFT